VTFSGIACGASALIGGTSFFGLDVTDSGATGFGVTGFGGVANLPSSPSSPLKKSLTALL
jgi:hypothetical protein